MLIWVDFAYDHLKKIVIKLKRYTLYIHILIYCKYADRQAWPITVDPDHLLHSMASDQSLHCLPIIQQFLDRSMGNKTDLFKV